MIELEILGKQYNTGWFRRVTAVEGVTFSCSPGTVTGLLGPNGAGKTTTLRMIATALRPTSGVARVAGIDVVRHPAQVRVCLGFLSANTGLYERHTPRELLAFFARLHGLHGPAFHARLEALEHQFRMDEFLDKRCGLLSTGMKQKVSLARALLHDPPVVVLDEPTLGLDVITSRAILEFIRTCRAQGKTVLFSSHVMSEVRALCDRIVIIHHGRVYFEGSLAQYTAAYGEDLDDAFLRAVGEVPN